LALVLTTSLSGCKTGGSDGGEGGDEASAVKAIDTTLRLAPADVSFLLPLPRDEFQVKASDAGAKGELLSERNFGQVPGFVKRGHPNVQDPYSKMFITAVRIDPCAPQVAADADPARCGNGLIRLVAQLVEKDRPPTDAGIHLIYKFDADEFAQVIEDVQELKRLSPVPTDGEPIGVHPGLRGLDGQDPAAKAASVAFGAKVKEFILKHVGKKNYFATSAMVTLDRSLTADKPPGSITWEWSIGVVALGQVTRLPVTGVSGIHFTQQFTARGRDGTVSPESKVVPEMAAILSASPPAPDANPAAYNASFRIENPTLFTIPQGDCVSCHLSSPGRIAAEGKFGQEITGVDKFVSPAGVVSPMADGVRQLMGNQVYVVLNFAYFFGKPSVSQRTINETMEIIRFLNTSVIH
jgi:hypothetical protein